MRVNDTKYDLCQCNHPRSQHVRQLKCGYTIFDERTPHLCVCEKFTLKEPDEITD